MMIHHPDFTLTPSAALMAAANAAARAIPPLFPLAASVAVNPYLGQTGDTLAMTAARLGPRFMSKKVLFSNGLLPVQKAEAIVFLRGVA